MPGESVGDEKQQLTAENSQEGGGDEEERRRGGGDDDGPTIHKFPGVKLFDVINHWYVGTFIHRRVLFGCILNCLVTEAFPR